MRHWGGGVAKPRLSHLKKNFTQLPAPFCIWCFFPLRKQLAQLKIVINSSNPHDLVGRNPQPHLGGGTPTQTPAFGLLLRYCLEGEWGVLFLNFFLSDQTPKTSFWVSKKHKFLIQWLRVNCYKLIKTSHVFVFQKKCQDITFFYHFCA